ncbi:MAG: hypothetical protein EOP09_14485 [Proteobacteria bacterium]|nr:MAG: hypothetical protein EOP09_14485 [Pseudomonadota bacterium]
MKELKLHVASEIVDGTEELWVSSDSTVIHLSIEVGTGIVRGFSCRLGPGVVAEMGETRNVVPGHVYPSLCIFTEDANHNASRQQFCTKVDDEWSIEY